MSNIYIQQLLRLCCIWQGIGNYWKNRRFLKAAIFTVLFIAEIPEPKNNAYMKSVSDK